MTDLAAANRFVHLAAAVILAGGFAFSVVIARPALRRVTSVAPAFLGFFKTQSQIARASLLALFVSALIGLWIQSVTVSGSSDLASLKLLLTETQYGTVWIARLIMICSLAGLLLIERSGRIKDDSTFFGAAGLVLSACLLMSIAPSGHAAAAEGRALAFQLSADGLHLLAAGAWLGGLVPLAILLNASKRHGDAPALTIAGEATRRFSRIGVVCVTVLMATGAFNAWFLVGSVPALVGTPYGRLLLIKIALLFPLLGLAAMNRLKLKPRLAAASLQNRSGIAFELVAKLKRNVIAETSLGMVVLLIVGSMGVTPPARHAQPEWPFSFRMSWGLIENAPKARAEVERGTVWAAIGLIALIAAIFRRRRRVLLTSIGIGTLAYAAFLILTPVTIDAYPMTYRRPAVAYQAISVANGLSLYRDSCVICHGIEGYGDGPAAEDLRPKPADLTAPHAANHTAGDLYWWLSYGVKQTAMPGFSESLSEEERWDLINFLRALSSAERARSLAPVIENEPWLVAPDFVYGTDRGEAKALKDHRDSKMILLVVFASNSLERLIQLDEAKAELEGAGVDLILVPGNAGGLERNPNGLRLGLPIVTDGRQEISDTYSLFQRSFAGDQPSSDSSLGRHLELLIDKQGYIRARWLPAEGDAWRKLDNLMSQIEILRKEKPRAPAPDEHVH